MNPGDALLEDHTGKWQGPDTFLTLNCGLRARILRRSLGTWAET